MSFRKPCLDCGVLVRGATRCAKHQAIADARVAQYKSNRLHYKGDYARRAKIVRDTAVTCWLCGDGYRPDDPFTADHVEAGNPNSILLPAHKSCNSRRGNRPPPPGHQ